MRKSIISETVNQNQTLYYYHTTSFLIFRILNYGYIIAKQVQNSRLTKFDIVHPVKKKEQAKLCGMTSIGLVFPHQTYLPSNTAYHSHEHKKVEVAYSSHLLTI